MAKPKRPEPSPAHRIHPDLWAKLTEREDEILTLYLHNPNDKEIARQLRLALSTVRSHLSAIEKKFGVGSRNELFSLFVPQ